MFGRFWRISGKCKKPLFLHPPRLASVGGSRCVLWFWNSVLLRSPGRRHQSLRCGVQAHGPVHTGPTGPFLCFAVLVSLVKQKLLFGANWQHCLSYC